MSKNVSQTTTPSPLSQNQVPDLLKIGAVQTDTDMNVQTDILDPVVQSNSFIRFAFQNKGILHSMSKINFCLKNVGTSSVFPLNIGVYSLIQRATLKIGAKTICEIDDFNQFMAYKSLFVGNEAMKEREQYLTSRITNFGFEYKNQSISGENAHTYGQYGLTAVSVGASAGVPKAGDMNLTSTMARAITIDNGWDGITASGNQAACPALNGADANGAPPNDSKVFPNKAGTGSGGGAPATSTTGHPEYETGYWQVLKKTTEDVCPHFQVSIADLCPFLRVNQLPLYMMDELVSLELSLSGDSDRLFCQNTPTQTCQIDTTKTQMIADYIYYPQEMMMAYAQANASLEFTYVDYRLSKYSVAPAGGQMSKSTTIRNVGGAGRVITRVFFGVQDLDFKQAQPLGSYQSSAPSRTYNGAVTEDNANVNGKITVNLKYNDDFLYPIDVSNNARQFHNTAEAEGLVPFIGRECYSREGESLTPASLRTPSSTPIWSGQQGMVERDALSGRFFWQSMRLSDNVRINSRGLELYYTTTGSGETAFPGEGPANSTNGMIQRVWLETVKKLTLANGFVEVSFA